MAKPTVFIDGEAGTTGLQIRDRLQSRSDIELVSIDPAKRKDVHERQRLLNGVDVAILCLPDAAARESVGLVTNSTVKILDASTAHRTAEGWVYGFPELEPGCREAIADSKRVSNPGCYPTGFLACTRPLVANGQISKDYPITLNAVSGYSGGGTKTDRKLRIGRGISLRNLRTGLCPQTRRRNAPLFGIVASPFICASCRECGPGDVGPGALTVICF